MASKSTWRNRVRALAAGALPGALAALIGAGAAGADSAPDKWGKDWCTEPWSDGRAHACEVRDLPALKAPPVLEVEVGPNGGVEVAAGDRAEVSGRARVAAWADTEEEARALLAQVRIVPTAHGFAAEGPEPATGSGRSRGDLDSGWNVQFRIEAPAAQALDLETENGPLAVYGMRGRSVLRTENGPLAIDHCGGDMLARTTNGPLSVTLTGATWSGRGLVARSDNGPVALSVPAKFDADLEYGTIHGPWMGPRTLTVEQRSSYAHARLGKGGKPIAVTTENGPFTMHGWSH